MQAAEVMKLMTGWRWRAAGVAMPEAVAARFGGGEVSVTEAEADAHDLFRNCDGLSEDGMEAWMADQPWEVAPGGWMVTSELQGWRFAVEPIPEALRLTAWPPSGSPAAWEVLPR